MLRKAICVLLISAVITGIPGVSPLIAVADDEPVNNASITASGTITSNGSNLPWRLYDDDTLVVDSGFINWRGWQSPWPSTTRRIIITGPIIAGEYLSDFFSYLIFLESIEGLHYFDTKNVRNMRRMFYNAYNLTALDVFAWDVSNVTAMQSLFYNAASLTSLDLSSWDTRNVGFMSDMMSGMSSLRELKLGEYFAFALSPGAGLPLPPLDEVHSGLWQNVGEGTSDNPKGEYVYSSRRLMANYNGSEMAGTWVWHRWEDGFIPSIVDSGVFTANGSRLQWRLYDNDTNEVDGGFINLSGASRPWPGNTRRIAFTGTIVAGESLQRLFSGLRSISLIEGLHYFDTRNVRDMSHMFFRTDNLEFIDLTSWDTSSVRNMSRMFLLTNAKIDVSGINTGNVTDMSSMFSSTNLSNIKGLSELNTVNVSDMREMFRSTSGSIDMDLSRWNTSNLQQVDGMFSNAPGIKSLNLSSWNVSKVTNMWYMFSSARNLASIEGISAWNTSNVTSMREMFSRTALTSLDLSGWDTRNVQYMENMFLGAGSLTTLDLSGWDTSSVISMGGPPTSICQKTITLPTLNNLIRHTAMKAHCMECLAGHTIYGSSL